MPRIPADVERPDRVAFNLTAHQLALLAATGVLAWLLAAVARLLIPPAVALALTLPVIAVGAAVALGSRDGLPLDQFALAALRQMRRPRRRVLAPEGVPKPPALLAQIARSDGPAPAPLALPVQGIDPDGAVDLGRDGAALVCQASTVNFALRTQAEQEALVAAFARVLHALTGPLQLVVTAERVDVAGLITELEQTAGGLPHPALEAAARGHAAFLGDLARRRDVLRRVWLVVFRDPAPLASGAAVRLARRAEEAAGLLQAAGVHLASLDRASAAAVLQHALDPGAPSARAEFAAVGGEADQPVRPDRPPTPSMPRRSRW